MDAHAWKQRRRRRRQVAAAAGGGAGEAGLPSAECYALPHPFHM
jgi:hypothetical protein